MLCEKISRSNFVNYHNTEREMIMSKIGYCEPKEAGTSSVNVSVDVTKIVKYVCLAGIAIVGIVFGTKCYQKMIENDII